VTALTRDPNLADPDAVYERLIRAHEGLDEAASRKLNAMLILILANHVGDTAVLEEAFTLARDRALTATGPSPGSGR